MDTSRPSMVNFEPQQATDSTQPQSPKPNAWRSPTMLSEAEIKSLRQETQQDSLRLKALIAASKLNAPKG